MSACIDCGTPTTDGPLCNPCAEVAGALLGGADARVEMLTTTPPERRTKRRYASELYPHAEEGEIRDLSVEVPCLYAQAQGLGIGGTSWYDMLHPDQPDDTRRLAVERTDRFVQAARIALLADALTQGLAGQEAWEWAEARSDGDSLGEWVWERGSHYGVDMARIKPYPCGPEPQTHDHMASTGDSMGQGVITGIDGPESECPACTEPIEP